MDSNPILHLSPAKEMKCSFLYYVQLLMIGWAGRWTQTPSTTAFQPKMWNALFFITFYIWCWPDWSMDLNLIHHPSPAKKMKSSFLGYVQLLMISRACWWSQTPSVTPLQPIKWNAHFWITFNFWWLARLVDGLKPHPPPSPANKMKCFFWICVYFWWSARLVDGLKPHLPPLSRQKNKMLTFGLHSLWMISQAGQWTQTPSTTPLQPKTWNAYFWIMFNFWWSAGLVNGVEPHTPPLSSQKNEMLIFGLCSLLMICLADWRTWTPSATPLLPKKWNAPFSNTFNFYWSARLVDGLKPHPSPLSHQKNEMLIFGLRSTSDDQPGWSMASNPICHPSPANKMKCSFWIKFNFWWSARLVDGLKLRSPPFSSQKKWNAHFLIMFNFWWLAGLVDGLKAHPPLLSSQKLKCSFFGLCSLLMIGWAGWWTWTPSATPLQPKKWNAHFSNTFNFWWSAWLVNGLETHLPPFSTQKNEMLIFGLCSTSHDLPDWLMDSDPIHCPSPAKKMKCSFFGLHSISDD